MLRRSKRIQENKTAKEAAKQAAVDTATETAEEDEEADERNEEWLEREINRTRMRIAELKKDTKKRNGLIEKCKKETKNIETKAETVLEKMRTAARKTRDIVGKEFEMRRKRAEGGVPKEMAVCRRCKTVYSEAEDEYPEVMDCGHSICNKCVTELVDGRDVKCPVDGKISKVSDEANPSLTWNITLVWFQNGDLD